MKGLYRVRTSRYWRYTFRVRGKRFRVSLGVEDIDRAEKIARRLRAAADTLNDQLLPECDLPRRDERNKRRRIGVMLRAYLDEAERRGRLPRTLEGYRSKVRAIYSVMPEETPLRALCSQRGIAFITGYVRSRQAAGAHSRSISEELRILRAAWDVAVQRGMAPSHIPNPIERARACRPAASPRRDCPIFTGRRELDAFCRVVMDTDADLCRFLQCARYTGLRPSEIERVHWDHVSLEAGVLRWTNHKAGGRAGIALVQTRALIEKAIRVFREMPMGHVAPGQQPGHPFLRQTTFRTRWRKLIADHPEYDDSRYLPQSLRHRLNSMLIDSGCSTAQVQLFLGHATAAMTHLTYSEHIRSATQLGGLRVDSI